MGFCATNFPLALPWKRALMASTFKRMLNEQKENKTNLIGRYWLSVPVVQVLNTFDTLSFQGLGNDSGWLSLRRKKIRNLLTNTNLGVLSSLIRS